MRWWILESESVIDDFESVRNELNWVGLDVEEGTDGQDETRRKGTGRGN